MKAMYIPHMTDSFPHLEDLLSKETLDQKDSKVQKEAKDSKPYDGKSYG